MQLQNHLPSPLFYSASLAASLYLVLLQSYRLLKIYNIETQLAYYFN